MSLNWRNDPFQSIFTFLFYHRMVFQIEIVHVPVQKVFWEHLDRQMRIISYNYRADREWETTPKGLIFDQNILKYGQLIHTCIVLVPNFKRLFFEKKLSHAYEYFRCVRTYMYVCSQCVNISNSSFDAKSPMQYRHVCLTVCVSVYVCMYLSMYVSKYLCTSSLL